MARSISVYHFSVYHPFTTSLYPFHSGTVAVIVAVIVAVTVAVTVAVPVSSCRSVAHLCCSVVQGDVDGAVGSLIAKLLGCGAVYLSNWLEHDNAPIRELERDGKDEPGPSVTYAPSPPLSLRLPRSHILSLGVVCAAAVCAAVQEWYVRAALSGV